MRCSYLIGKLLDLLMLPRPTERALRALTPERLQRVFWPQSVPSTPGTQDELPVPIIALSSYADPLVRAAVIEAKFHGNRRAARLLGTLLATYLSVSRIAAPSIIPIPLSKDRQRARGYNQAARIAQAAVRSLPESALAANNPMTRTRDTLPQTSLGRRNRLTNITGAFAISGPLDPAHTYIVLDDVTTTGATLSEAVWTLHAAGARHVVPIAIAYQPIGKRS